MFCCKSQVQRIALRHRNYSNVAYEVFDRHAKMLQRNRAARNVTLSRETDYVKDEVAFRTAERLAFVSRRFDRVLNLGSGPGNLERLISDPNTPDSELIQSRLGKIVMLDSSKDMLYRDSDPSEFEFNKKMDIERIVADEEKLDHPALAPNSFDAVISSMSMHWINDLPGVLKKIERILKPDGMFMANMIGGDSLFELRTSLQLAEMERYNRISPRLSPLADVKDIGGLLQQAKFNLLTVDMEDIVVSYPDMFALIADLQAMGESNAIKMRPNSISQDLLQAANAIYKDMHGEEDGSIPATFRVINMIGWKHSPTQPKPLERGTADVNLKQVLQQNPN